MSWSERSRTIQMNHFRTVIDPRPSHLPSLDGLRGVAVFMVMLFHCAAFGLPFKHPLLNAGVDLFFVLSGFLITRILLRVRGEPSYFRNFFGRRALRIFPLYYVALVVYLILRPKMSGNSIPPVDQQLYFWIYLQNIPYTFGGIRIEPGHFWSLAVEEHFYLVWPFIVRVMNPRSMKWVLLFLIVGALLLRVPMLAEGYNPYYFTLTRIDALSAGSLLGYIERFQGSMFSQLQRPAAIVVLAILGTLLAVSLSIDIQTLPMFAVWWHSLMTLLFVGLIAWLVASKDQPSLLNTILKMRWLCWVGSISYGLYVWHPFAYLIARRVFADRDGWVVAGLGFILSVFLAAISYYAFERWFLRAKKYFT